MTDSQPEQTYKWINRQQYQHNNIQQHGDKLTTKHSDQQQQRNVQQLFYHTMKDSQVTLVHLDDLNKETKLYTIPKYQSSFTINNGCFNYFTGYGNAQNRFKYYTKSQYHYNFKQFKFYGSAVTQLFQHQTVFFWNVCLNKRLDNAFSSNAHQFGLRVIKNNVPHVDQLQLDIARQARFNFLSYFDKDSQKSYKFGSSTVDSSLPKQSNSWYLGLRLKKGLMNLVGGLGYDFGNQSLRKVLKGSTQKQYYIGQNLKINLLFEGAKLWGKNILKNDMFAPHDQKWIGYRTDNYLTAKAQIVLTKFPYLHLFKWDPYLYGQVWTIFNKKQINGAINAKVLGEYGIGFASKDKRFKFNFSLFNCSTQRQGGSFGVIKFSF